MPMISSTMRSVRSVCLTAMAAMTAAAGVPAPNTPLDGPDVAAEARPLLQELAKTKYSLSRCLLPPVLATNGRNVALNDGKSFQAGDAVLAVDDDTLPLAGGTTLIDLLEHRVPGSTLRVRVLRGGSERTVNATCGDAKPYYDALRAGAQAAVAGDVGACADRLDGAAATHGLSSIWLRLAMSCKIRAGRLAGTEMWRTDYELYRQRILETKYTPAALDHIRHGVKEAVRDLRGSGNVALADELSREYAAAVAALPAGGAEHPDDAD